jgi:hypothetical protein
MQSMQAIETLTQGTIIRLGKSGKARLVAVNTEREGYVYYTINRYMKSRDAYSKSPNTYVCTPGSMFEVL